MVDLVLYAPEKLRPAVVDVVKAIAEEYPEVGQVAPWHKGINPFLPVLGFNAIPAETPVKFVKTMSQKQVLSKASVVTELTAALDLLLKETKLREFNYRTISVGEQLPQMGNIVVVDIETAGDVKTWLPEEMWLLSCAIYDGKTNVVCTEEWLRVPKNKEALRQFLTKSNRKLVAHNMKFDFRSLSAQVGAPIYGHMDTMLLHHAINPGAGDHGLKSLCAKYLGAPDWDATSKQYVKGNYKLYPTDYYYPKDLYNHYTEKFGKVKVGFEAIPKDVLYKYNAEDVYWTWHLMEYLIDNSDERIQRVAKHEYRMGNFFQDIEGYGIAVDSKHLDALAEEFGAEKEKHMEKLAELVSPDFNPNSPKQVQEVLSSAGHNMASTSEGDLEDMLAGGVHPKVREFVQTLLDVRGTTKMLGVYNKGIRDRMHNGRVYPTYKVHGTNTGRMSAADPNIQNIPRDKRLRKLFTVSNPDEFDFIECDYSQAELRTMAILSDDDYLKSLFQPGMPDFFDSLLPVTFPKANISEWSAQEKKDNRAKLKGIIYGLSYGRKANAIAHALDMSPREAQQIIDNYFDAAPNFYQWRQDVEYKALSYDGVLETVFGRRFQSELVTGRSKTNVVNSALSFLPQSTASDICVSAAIEIHKWIEKDYSAHIVGSIHDAILVEAPKKYTEEIAHRMQEEMAASAVRALGDSVPFDTDAEWGTSWGTTGVTE